MPAGVFYWMKTGGPLNFTVGYNAFQQQDFTELFPPG